MDFMTLFVFVGVSPKNKFHKGEVRSLFINWLIHWLIDWLMNINVPQSYFLLVITYGKWETQGLEWKVVLAIFSDVIFFDCFETLWLK